MPVNENVPALAAPCASEFVVVHEKVVVLAGFVGHVHVTPPALVVEGVPEVVTPLSVTVTVVVPVVAAADKAPLFAGVTVNVVVPPGCIPVTVSPDTVPLLGPDGVIPTVRSGAATVIESVCVLLPLLLPRLAPAGKVPLYVWYDAFGLGSPPPEITAVA